jgi:hypothetical protein
MKVGDRVTILTPLRHIGDGVVAAKRGIYKGWKDGERVVEAPNGIQWLIPRGSETRLTTKHIDISPCGLKE